MSTDIEQKTQEIENIASTEVMDAEELESISTTEEIEEISMTFSAISNESGKQQSMLKSVRSQDQLRETILQLSKRLRVKPPIYKIKEIEPWSRIPERRQALVDFEI